MDTFGSDPTDSDSDFGSTLVAQRNAACAQSGTRAVFAGGHTTLVSPYGNTNLMEFVSISTTANCIDFGDLNWDLSELERNEPPSFLYAMDFGDDVFL